MQEFPDEYIELLQNSDLTSDNDRTICIQAATLLTQALCVQLQPGKGSELGNSNSEIVLFKEWKRWQPFGRGEIYSNKPNEDFRYAARIFSVVNLFSM